MKIEENLNLDHIIYKMYCLDTNIVIDFLRGNKLIINKINFMQQNNKMFITAITLCELYRGAFLSSRKDYQLDVIEKFVESIEVLNLEKNACKIFGEEFARLQKIGKITQQLDLIIASIVKANNLVIVTRDKKHFQNLGIRIEEW